ncbi:MAG: hypothetical protein PUG07_08210 [Ruminococcus sp.]|uniref:hypothetical protein n=1 Tax=Blautia massiliensis (ex Durand et al. 2017) TaxID=1737424 RepID=UPI00243127F8|nr:hypothetical protein [Blautia massiliensis (ex Durand et al. 2017)]MDD6375757.1 hypothetical protein [Ruminococcus sp.]MDD6549441.1 hypothetical protein [Blautia massiliensis (ex Durand et al. 2017)]
MLRKKERTKKEKLGIEFPKISVLIKTTIVAAICLLAIGGALHLVDSGTMYGLEQLF